MVSLSVMYILRTHLLEDPDVVFYYQGTAKEQGVPFALNTIVSFEPANAAAFYSRGGAIWLCDKLNQDKESLARVGYSEFEVVAIKKD